MNIWNAIIVGYIFAYLSCINNTNDFYFCLLLLLVLIWDDDAKEFVLEFTFKSKVFAVRMSHKRLVVVLHNKIHIFSFPNNCQKLFTFNTCDNPKGLCELSSVDDDTQLLCFPAVKSGFMQCAVSECF